MFFLQCYFRRWICLCKFYNTVIGGGYRDVRFDDAVLGGEYRDGFFTMAFSAVNIAVDFLRRHFRR
ncbi:MAG: hypothetical protein H6629_22300 [Calditrichae bacterium]|nr:hypothetical protein [Calditrichia bacterium]